MFSYFYLSCYNSLFFFVFVFCFFSDSRFFDSNDCSVRLFDLRASKSQGVLVGGVFHGVACNPTGPLFATAAFKKGTQLWDLRSFSRSSVPIVTYQSKTIDSSSVKWNSTGNLLGISMSFYFTVVFLYHFVSFFYSSAFLFH